MYEVATSMMTKQPKSERVEPLKAMSWNITHPIGLPPIPEVSEAVASAALS